MFRNAILIPLIESLRSCEKLNGNSLPSIIASVFSLKYANSGEPMIRKMYLNSEK